MLNLMLLTNLVFYKFFPKLFSLYDWRISVLQLVHARKTLMAFLNWICMFWRQHGWKQTTGYILENEAQSFFNCISLAEEFTFKKLLINKEAKTKLISEMTVKKINILPSLLFWNRASKSVDLYSSSSFQIFHGILPCSFRELSDAKHYGLWLAKRRLSGGA